MNTLRDHADEYLTIRRALGFKLVGEGRLLAGFVTFAEQSEASIVTTGLAVGFTRLATGGRADYLARRMRVVRSFAVYLHTIDPRTQIPPVDLFPARNHRPTPYIYADTDVAALMAAASGLTPALRAATTETLIGLLAATGLRISEAMALDRDDVDWSNGLLTVRNTKFGKSREVLLHPSTVKALERYADQRDLVRPGIPATSFFISTLGTPLAHTTIQPTFRHLLARTGLEHRSPRPRIHDLRHTFAVGTLTGWYSDGGDVAARLPLLSTYLGHVDPAATYWYLSAVPELLALAAARLEPFPGERS